MEWGGGTIPALSALNVRQGHIDLARTKHFGSPALYERWMTSGDPERGDIVITTEAPLGNVASIPDDEKYILSQRVILLRPDPAVLLKPFLEHHMRSASFQAALTANDSGTTVRGIRQSRLVKLTVPVPPLNEQSRIVVKIEALNKRSRAAREALEQVPPLLERFRQSVLAATFRGDLTAEWREQNPDVEPASKLLERIRAERVKPSRWKPSVDLATLPDLPRGWAWSTWSELADRVTVGFVGPMKKEYRETGIPFLRGQNVRENRYEPTGLCFISPEFHKRIKKSALHPGDLVVVRSGAVGVTCVVPEGLGEANCSDLVVIQGPRGVLPWYGSYYMNSAAKARVREGQVGVALTHFNTKSVAGLPIAVPPLEEQHVIVQLLDERLGATHRIEGAVQAQLEQLPRLDQAILAKAFRGELVPQDPDDEPASVLLGRIRAEREAAAPKKHLARRKRTTKKRVASDEKPQRSSTNNNGTRSNSVPTVETVLGVLKKDALHQIAKAHDVELSDRRSLAGALGPITDADLDLAAVLEPLKVAELKEICREIGLKVSGAKAELRARIVGSS